MRSRGSWSAHCTALPSPNLSCCASCFALRATRSSSRSWSPLQRSAAALPADLADLLLVRLEQDRRRRPARRRAPPPSQGRRVSHELLACGAELGNAALDAAVRAAVEANILVALGDDGYGFVMPCLAEAVYQDLLPGERVRLHAAYAAALASHQVQGSAAELSRHARASHDLITATPRQHRGRRRGL